MERPILIQGAMACELAFFKNKLENSREANIGPYKFSEGTFNNTPVVLSRLTIGFAPTAAATALAIQAFNPKIIVNQGTAGGYTETIHNYDIVVGERYFNAGAIFTEEISAGETGIQLPWHYMDLTKLEAAESLQTCINSHPYYSNSDVELMHLVIEEAGRYTKGRLVRGTVASAEQWNTSPDFLAQLRNVTGADCEEMEAAAAGQVAAAWQVPFICLKVISNNNVTGEAFDSRTATALQEFIWGLFK